MSLRSRLILSFTLIIFICLSIVALALAVLLRDYGDQVAMVRLVDMTRPVYVQFLALMRGRASFDQVWMHLEEQADETQTCILLFDGSGKVIRKACSEKVSLDDPVNLPLRDASVRQYRGVYTSATGQKFVYVAYPLSGLPSTPGIPPSSTLVLAISLREALSVWIDFAAPLFWAGLIAFCVSIIIAFFLARSVYLPVQRVTKAASAIAEGNYEQQIPVGGAKEIQELTASFNRMSTEVKRSQQVLRDFIADVSHELRSPLTAIKGFAQAIVDGTAKDTESQRKAAAIIEDESRRMMRLVEELLEFSRLESGQVSMAKDRVDVNDLLRQCQELFALRAQESGVKLILDVVGALPPVTGDVDRLEQVVNNLVDNALKHTPSGGTVRIGAASPSAAFVAISVSDTGAGIPAEQITHIFERFYHADSPGSKNGAGLGLAITREIVRAHSGTITVASVPGKGTTFSVNLPVWKI